MVADVGTPAMGATVESMRAAVTTPDGTFDVRDVPLPELQGDDWVRIRVRCAGICGTDLRRWKKPQASASGAIVGHELAGEVVEVGSAVSSLSRGDRVVVETVMGDGTCPWCRARQYNVCPHLYDVRSQSVSRAFAQYVSGPQDKMVPLPDGISFEEAALVDTFSVCLHAWHVGQASINDIVVVIGAGPIGLGQLMLAKASGCRVIVVDVHDAPLAAAADLGADVVVNATRTDAVQQVMELTSGRGADVVFECAGGEAMDQTLRQATEMARRAGSVVIVGGFEEGDLAIPLEWQRIQKSEIRLLPSASFALHGIYPEEHTVVELLSRGVLDAERLITHRFDLEHINDAFAAAADKDNTGAIFVALTMT